jgi:hypothetical protein
MDKQIAAAAAAEVVVVVVVTTTISLTQIKVITEKREK